MIIYHQTESNKNEGVVIPAIWEDGNLIFANNGISEKFFGASPEGFDRFNRRDFIHCADVNTPAPRPFFTKISMNEQDSEEIWDLWELYYVFHKRSMTSGKLRKKDIMYTCLVPCKKDTILCKCDDCGEKFVLIPSEVRFYQDRDLAIPTVRCPKCIQSRKINNR